MKKYIWIVLTAFAYFTPEGFIADEFWVGVLWGGYSLWAIMHWVYVDPYKVKL